MRIALGMFGLVDGAWRGKRGEGLRPPSPRGFHWAGIDRWRGSARPTVVLLHGLDEPGRIWDEAAPAVWRAGHGVVRFEYPNDQAIAASAEAFERAMAKVDLGPGGVVIVGHSMGGLIARDALTRGGAWAEGVRRLITVGTPNHGSAWARLRWAGEVREQAERWVDLVREGHGWVPAGSASARGVRGGAARDLLPGSGYLKELNGRGLPGCAMTVILGRWVGGAGTWRASVGRALLESLGDGVVSVASARLAGVADTVEIAGNHRTMLRSVAGMGTATAIPVILERLRRG